MFMSLNNHKNYTMDINEKENKKFVGLIGL